MDFIIIIQQEHLPSSKSSKTFLTLPLLVSSQPLINSPWFLICYLRLQQSLVFVFIRALFNFCIVDISTCLFRVFICIDVSVIRILTFDIARSLVVHVVMSFLKLLSIVFFRTPLFVS